MARISDSEALAAVEAETETARDVMRFVHGHAELAHEEHRCSAHVAATLEHAGYAVERGVGGMPTAFRASLSGARPGRSVGLVALYDAVASIREDGSIAPVHSCGHGPIAGGVSAAALALAKLRDRLAGKIVIFGCPADEIHAPGTVEHGSGKALSASAGLWNGIDAALYAHPEFINTVSKRSLWMRRDYARISGRRSLKAGQVTAPMAALRPLADLVERLPPDQVMLEQMHLEGDVEEGTGLVLNATFLIFAEDEAGIAAHAKTLRATLTGAAWREGAAISGVRPNERVTAAVAEAFAATGRDFVANPPPLPFATDFGNVSQIVPAALIGIGRPGGWKFHTDEGAREFAGPAGEEAALGIARVMTLAATRLTEPV
ncbi:MAG TPA: M20/M25/M40 family metallo-hydrolase [Dongiaceae bacterium]|nr:M20/M25/M40 family metallo-hydrolase [Dongiaceae bacterium]